MVLHAARLCADEGGVERFLLGSELRALTRVRDENGAFPAVRALIQLAQDVRAILPETEISYGADWTEYGAYQTPEGDLEFPLDDLWADPAVGFIGIDNYLPLSDWRDGTAHLDAQTAESVYDQDYLSANIKGGEGYDWYYASPTDRNSQIRTPITDGMHDEPWVFRTKDLWSFWSERHHPRRGGIRQGPSSWVPTSKPIVFTEIGCPAIDKGPNQPNVFVDPKSSESAPPYHSNGNRDDAAQRAYLEAQHRYWQSEGSNPLSPLDGRAMVEADGLYVYAWDARPYPEFPLLSDVWADGPNWVTGHWLNGRAGRFPLGLLIETIARDAGFDRVNARACTDLVTGILLPKVEPARASLEPLLDLYQLDAVEAAGVLRVFPRTGTAAHALEEGQLVDREKGPVSRTWAQADDEVSALTLIYTDEFSGYELQASEVRDDTSVSDRKLRLTTALVMEEAEVGVRLASILAESRFMGAEAGFALPELADGLAPGSVVTLLADGQEDTLRIVRLTDGPVREIRAVGTGSSPFGLGHRSSPIGAPLDQPPPSFGPVAFEAFELPAMEGAAAEPVLHLAAFAEPWPGSVALHAGGGETAPLLSFIEDEAIMGRLIEPLAPAAAGRWDRKSKLRLRLLGGSLASRNAEDVLNGAHLAAVKSREGSWEVLQFAAARLEADGSTTLEGLLRGRFGSEEEAALGAAADARFVLLRGVPTFGLPLDRLGGTIELQAGPAGTLPGAFPFVTTTLSFGGRSLRPLSPVHLRARESASEVRLTWVRRTREGGDRWNGGDVPLGETEERYRISLLDGARRALSSFETERSEALFARGDAVFAEVVQLSAAVGPGTPAIVRL
jgi:hypothetical protein